MTTPFVTNLKRGDRIQTTGAGRTANWQHTYHGTVTRRRGNSVFVAWDNLHFEEEMFPEEVKREDGHVPV